MELVTKFNKWISNARKGAKDFELVYPNKDTYIMTMEDCMEKICDLEILIWENGKLTFQYCWSVGQELEDKAKVIFITKKQKKMMLCVEDKKVYSFGTDDVKKTDENQELLVYRKGMETSSLIFASSQRERIEQLNAINFKGNKIDATEIVIKQIIKEMILKQKNGKETIYEENC